MSVATEKQVKLAAKMYECRDTCRQIFREKWPARRDEFQAILRIVMKQENVDELGAALHLCVHKVGDDAMTQIQIVGAATEMIEPEDRP